MYTAPFFLLCKFFRSEKHPGGIAFGLWAEHPPQDSVVPVHHAVCLLTLGPTRSSESRPDLHDPSQSLDSTYGVFTEACEQGSESGCAFFLIWGYFIGQVVIFPPLPIQITILENCFISLAPMPDAGRCQPPVKCNDAPIITLKLTLTSIRSMLLLEHNKGERYVKQ